MLLGEESNSYSAISRIPEDKFDSGDFRQLPGGPRPMLLWYVWMHIVDGAWHKLDEIAKQLRIPGNAVSWAAKFLSDHGMAEMGFEEDEIRVQKTHPRLEDVVKTLHGGPKADKDSVGSTEFSTSI
jgi:hypothetical protein